MYFSIFFSKQLFSKCKFKFVSSFWTINTAFFLQNSFYQEKERKITWFGFTICMVLNPSLKITQPYA